MRSGPDDWFSRVGNATRQAVSYRSGRVLLAGDAAHIHFPAGGQGLNLGLGDATNLGWKLAATIQGWAPPWLLDSYGVEREPVGLEVIADSRAQCALFANPTPDGVALRDRFSAILGAHPSLNQELAFRLSGLALRYGSGPVGQRVPDRSPGVFSLLRSGRFVLLGSGAQPGYDDRLVFVPGSLGADWPDTAAVLIRPDGYIAWSLGRDDPPAPPPLEHWLGPP